MGQSQTFYRFDWSKGLTALQGGVHDFLEPPSVQWTALDFPHGPSSGSYSFKI